MLTELVCADETHVVKNFENALKHIRSVILKSYFKIDLHYFFFFFFNLDQGVNR